MDEKNLEEEKAEEEEAEKDASFAAGIGIRADCKIDMSAVKEGEIWSISKILLSGLLLRRHTLSKTKRGIVEW